MLNLLRAIILFSLGLSTSLWADPPKPLAFPKASPEVLELCAAITANLADNGKALEKILGKADKVEKVSLPNRHHPDTKDMRHMYRYNDGLVSIYTVPSLKLSFLEAAIFTKDFWPETIPMLLALSPDEVTDKLGKPDEEDKERIVYLCSYETGDSINLLLANGRVYRFVLRKVIE
ncbi:MAG: hypothetical protein OEX12_06700 [Gammaproteobacteria bacterium]|nr:hypothetical protein [Gammaproteobacteria bacterium]